MYGIQSSTAKTEIATQIPKLVRVSDTRGRIRMIHPPSPAPTIASGSHPLYFVHQAAAVNAAAVKIQTGRAVANA